MWLFDVVDDVLLFPRNRQSFGSNSPILAPFLVLFFVCCSHGACAATGIEANTAFHDVDARGPNVTDAIATMLRPPILLKSA